MWQQLVRGLIAKTILGVRVFKDYLGSINEQQLVKGLIAKTLLIVKRNKSHIIKVFKQTNP